MQNVKTYCPSCCELVNLNQKFCLNEKCKANIQESLYELSNPFLHQSFISKSYGVITKCPKCSMYIPTTHKFCMECGHKINHLKNLCNIPEYKTCPYCDSFNKIERNYCEECGKPFVDFLHSLKRTQVLQNPEKLKELHNIEKIKEQVQKEGRVELEVLRFSLDMEKALFYTRIFDWVEQIGLKIENKWVLAEDDQIEKFLNQLDCQFLDWKHTEKQKNTKLL